MTAINATISPAEATSWIGVGLGFYRSHLAVVLLPAALWSWSYFAAFVSAIRSAARL